MTIPARDIEPLYYFYNFEHLLNTVSQLHFPLLTDDEKADIASFKALSLEAQLLWLRLLSRKGALVRIDKIRYKEITKLPAAIDELCKEGFIALNPSLEAIYWLDIVTLVEIKTIFKVGAKSKRAAAIGSIVDLNSDDAIEHKIRTFAPAIQALRTSFTTTIKLLYFGNLYQDLSEFIITELGHVQYPKYQVTAELSPFKSRADIDKVLNRTAFDQYLDEYLNEDNPDYSALIRQMHTNDHITSQQWHRVGYQLEREEDLKRSLSCYERSTLCVSRERMARVQLKLGHYQEVASLVDEMLAYPIDDSEPFTAERIGQKLKKTAFAVSLPIIDYPTEKITLEKTSSHPELNVIEHYATIGTVAFWYENSIWLTLFGLLFWDEIYSACDGAFLHPFQQAPLDLHRSSFLDKRRALFLARVEQLITIPLENEVRNKYHLHKGTTTRLINWEIPLPDLVTIVNSIKPEKLLELLYAIAENVRTRRSGFPDLAVIDNHQLKLREVKGPGDQLRDNQRFWLSWFNNHGWDVGVVHVRYH